MENREVINVLLHHKEAFEISGKTADAIDMAIEALKKQGQDRWHSVAKEGNPKENNNYLVTLENGKVMEDFYHVPDNEWSTASRIGCGVVAWMPLPDPYTGEEA